MNALYAGIVNFLLHRWTKSSLQTSKADWLMKQFCVSRRTEEANVYLLKHRY